MARQAIVFGAVIVTVGVIVAAVLLYKKQHQNKNPPSSSAPQSQQQQQRRAALLAAYTNGPQQQIAAPAMVGLYAGSGPQSPGTYAFSTDGPRYGATVGTGVSTAIQALNSPRMNIVGSFLPISSRVASC